MDGHRLFGGRFGGAVLPGGLIDGPWAPGRGPRPLLGRFATSCLVTGFGRAVVAEQAAQDRHLELFGRSGELFGRSGELFGRSGELFGRSGERGRGGASPSLGAAAGPRQRWRPGTGPAPGRWLGQLV
jgi:hypothetical protein